MPIGSRLESSAVAGIYKTVSSIRATCVERRSAGNVAARVRPNFPLTTANLRKLTISTVVDASRLYETLPELQWPTFAEALRPAAEYYRTV